MKIVLLSRSRKIPSTRRMLDAAKARGHQVKVLNPTEVSVRLGRKSGLVYRARPLRIPDVVIPRIASSIASYGLAVVDQFQAHGAIVLNSARAIGVSRNPARCLQRLAAAGLDIPATVMSREVADLQSMVDAVGGVPVLVKLLAGGERDPSDDEDAHVALGLAHVFLHHDVVAQAEHCLEGGLERLARFAEHHAATLAAGQQLHQHRHAADVVDHRLEIADLARHHRRRNVEARRREALQAARGVSRDADGARRVEDDRAVRVELIDDGQAVAGDRRGHARDDDVGHLQRLAAEDQARLLAAQAHGDLDRVQHLDGVPPHLRRFDQPSRRRDAAGAAEEDDLHRTVAYGEKRQRIPVRPATYGSMRLLALVPLALSVGCQTYDFERVVPLFVAQTTDKTIVASRRLKPNVMLLVDNSGSMLSPVNPADPDCMVTNTFGLRVLCGSASAVCPTATCPTRTSELKSAMGTFLMNSGTIARLGLTVFPARDTAANGVLGCDPSSDLAVQLPVPTPTDTGTEAALNATAQQANMKIQQLGPQGGTPTAASLEFLGTYAGLTESSADRDDFRDDFVLLLTDGLPNCNGTNANNVCTGGPAAACDCTTGQGGCSGTDPMRGLCSKGCLDRDFTVQKVKELRQKGIKTIVVGFGAELSAGSGPAVLDAMAREGGFPRACPDATDAECGGAAGSCNATTKQCATSFFQAANGVELATALRKISEGFVVTPCEYLLKAKPSDERYLTVLIDEVSTVASPATFSYDFNANRVTFVGTLCERLKASTPQHPVSVEFRIVERF